MSRKRKILLPPDEPGLDLETKKRREALKHLQEMTQVEFIELLCQSGSHLPDGSVDPKFEATGRLQPKVVTREQIEAALKAGQADMDKIRSSQRKPRGRW